MSSLYDIDIFDPIDSDLESYRNCYTMCPELWGKFYISDLPGVDFNKWKEMKLFDGDKFTSNLSKISNKYGGIYVYSIEPNVIPGIGGYVMYIGKATKTEYENLRVRIQSYQKQIGNDYTRDRLHRLFTKWKEYIHVYYLEVDANADVITALEDRLIGAYAKPCCNSDIRLVSVKKAVRAFN